MEINSIGNINFEAKFKKNRLFKQVVTYAKEAKTGVPFDVFVHALDRISRAGEGTIILENKYSGKYCFKCPNFILGDNKICINAKPYGDQAVAMYHAILEMGILGKNLAELFGKKPKELSVEDIIKKYT